MSSKCVHTCSHIPTDQRTPEILRPAPSYFRLASLSLLLSTQFKHVRAIQQQFGHLASAQGSAATFDWYVLQPRSLCATWLVSWVIGHIGLCWTEACLEVRSSMTDIV